MHSGQPNPRASKKPPKLEIPKPDLSTPANQIAFLEDVIYRAMNGLESLSISRLAVYAVSVVRQVSDDDVIKRLEALEQANAK